MEALAGCLRNPGAKVKPRHGFQRLRGHLPAPLLISLSGSPLVSRCKSSSSRPREVAYMLKGCFGAGLCLSRFDGVREERMARERERGPRVFFRSLFLRKKLKSPELSKF